jgi:hypothetical protein
VALYIQVQQTVQEISKQPLTGSIPRRSSSLDLVSYIQIQQTSQIILNSCYSTSTSRKPPRLSSTASIAYPDDIQISDEKTQAFKAFNKDSPYFRRLTTKSFSPQTLVLRLALLVEVF